MCGTRRARWTRWSAIPEQRRHHYDFDATRVERRGWFVAFLSNATNLVDDPVLSGSTFTSGITWKAVCNWWMKTPTASARPTINLAVFSLSRYGRYVAFDSPDGSLVGGDNNHAYDVFVRDLFSNTTEMDSNAECRNHSHRRATISAARRFRSARTGNGWPLPARRMIWCRTTRTMNRMYSFGTCWRVPPTLVSVGSQRRSGMGQSFGESGHQRERTLCRVHQCGHQSGGGSGRHDQRQCLSSRFADRQPRCWSASAPMALTLRTVTVTARLSARTDGMWLF